MNESDSGSIYISFATRRQISNACNSLLFKLSTPLLDILLKYVCSGPSLVDLG